MDDQRGTLERPHRSRGLTRSAAAAILVGVTVATVGGAFSLGQLLYPSPRTSFGPPPPSVYADEVLTAPQTAPAEEPALVEVPAAPAPAPAAEEVAAPRPRHGGRPPRATGAEGDDRGAARPTPRVGLGGDSADPLAAIDFDEIEG